MRQLQQKVEKFIETHNLKHSPEVTALDLVSEVGEVAKEILKSTNYGKEEEQYRPEIKSEIGDVLYSFIALANHYQINLEEALEIVLVKYEKRLKKGSVGSESE